MLQVCPKSATVHATFDGSDPANAPALTTLEIEAPEGATRLRVIARVGRETSPEAEAPLAKGMDEPHGPFDRNPRVIKLDASATLTSRIEPKDTGLAFTALDTLAKIPGATVYGGSIEVSSVRSDGDYLTLRMGRDVGIVGADLDSIVKTLVERLGAKEPVLKLRLDKIQFPSSRELTAFCDTMREDFDRVRWEQA